jgi:hypothetical protein
MIPSSTARGIVAAMAMTGMRRVTKGVGLVHEAPPETIAERGAIVGRLMRRVPAENRDEVIELAHWAYGALGGAAFGALPHRLVRFRWAGPVYGLAIWALFETGLVPLLGLEDEKRKRSAVERVAIAADHVLYGAVVAGRPRGTTEP